MRYRKLDDAGDYVFGRGVGDFLVDSPEAVAQAVKTRLGLRQGEWFLNIKTGTPYDTKILGMGMMATYDSAIQERILGTQGVRQITAYSSSVDPNTRTASINATIDTIYGPTTVGVTL
jgi:hypothetical protein